MCESMGVCQQATPDKQDTVEGSPSSSTDDLLPIEEELVHSLCPWWPCNCCLSYFI